MGALEYFRGDSASGFTYLEHAFRLDPTDPLVLMFATTTMSFSDESEHAAEMALHFVNVNPDMGIMYTVLAYAAGLAG